MTYPKHTRRSTLPIKRQPEWRNDGRWWCVRKTGIRALTVVDVIVTAIVQSILGGVNISAAREPYSARMLRERPRAFDEPDGVWRAGLPSLHACDMAFLRPSHASEKLIFLPPFDSRPRLQPDCALQRRMRDGMRSGEWVSATLTMEWFGVRWEVRWCGWVQ